MSERSEYVRVYDKKKKIERTVTKAAYNILKGKTYELIGGASESVETQPTVQKKRNDVVAAGDNQAPVETVAEPEGIVVRRKPGPKPKNNA